RDGAGPDDLQGLLRKANSAIWEKAQSGPHLRGMGTTCTLLLIADGSAHLAHIGDSRPYLYRTGRLSQLTDDHTLVGRMVRDGRLSREEAAHHPQRNVITAALGLDAQVDIDLLTIELIENDRLVVCSDGLSSMIDDETLAEVLSKEKDPQPAAERLVDAANDAGGEDNITVVVVDVVGDSAAGAGSTYPAARTNTPAEPPVGRGATGWGKNLVLGALFIVLLIGGAIAARWFVLGHSWFVGPDAAGVITIYKGIPDDIAGVTLKEPQQRTTLSLKALPQFLRSNVVDGIRVDSYGAAQTTIANLKQRVREFRQPTPSPAPSAHKKKKSSK
ncbi:MAG: SpoIIE family protein phosphatase, partial [Actinomycetota bacterium]|nr:SpoIIE family protein phosphatase [Actinomycetota bacterium]